MSPETARAVVEVWRQLSDGNPTARTFVKIADALPGDELVEGVGALLRGLPAQVRQAAELIDASAPVLAASIKARQATEAIDPFAFLDGPG